MGVKTDIIREFVRTYFIKWCLKEVLRDYIDERHTGIV